MKFGWGARKKKPFVATVKVPPEGFDADEMTRRTKEILGQRKPPDHWLKQIQTFSPEDVLATVRKILDQDTDVISGVIRDMKNPVTDTSVTSVPVEPAEKVIRISIALSCLKQEMLSAVLDETMNRMVLSYPMQKHPVEWTV